MFGCFEILEIMQTAIWTGVLLHQASQTALCRKWLGAMHAGTGRIITGVDFEHSEITQRAPSITVSTIVVSTMMDHTGAQCLAVLLPRAWSLVGKGFGHLFAKFVFTYPILFHSASSRENIALLFFAQ